MPFDHEACDGCVREPESYLGEDLKSHGPTRIFHRSQQNNNGDGSGNSGDASISINKNVGNDAHNTDSHNRKDSHDKQDSHNNQVSTSIDVPIFRRSQQINNGDGSGNSGDASVSINKNVGNNAYNTDSHDHKDSHISHDSHNNSVDTKVSVPVF